MLINDFVSSTYEITHHEIWKNTQYILTFKKNIKTFEFVIEDELECLIWNKEFSQPYITKLSEKIGQDLQIESLCEYIKKIFETPSLKPFIDIMYSNDAKSLVQKSLTEDTENLHIRTTTLEAEIENSDQKSYKEKLGPLIFHHQRSPQGSIKDGPFKLETINTSKGLSIMDIKLKDVDTTNTDRYSV